VRSALIPIRYLVCLSILVVACGTSKAEEEVQEGHHPIVVTNPVTKDVDTTRHFVCQIRASQHIELRALSQGYLQEIKAQEGQAVKQGQVLFKLLPVVYQARLAADQAELESADISLRNTATLAQGNVVSDQELALKKAERERAKAKVELATAELGFTEIKAPFDGIMGRQYEQKGSLLSEGDMLTTVSNNQLMWVYFNVPEADYLWFRSLPDAVDENHPQQLNMPDVRIELQLANGTFFENKAKETVTIESDFDNTTGNLLFRADFENAHGLLRHGQTGTLWIHEPLKNAIVIPQRATYEILDKRYVYVVGDDNVAHQRAVQVKYEADDVFVVDGVTTNEKIVIEGVRQTRDGEHLTVSFRKPEEVLANMKNHAQ
jgi:membrane fusion protein (multidrug efflux system)